MSIPRSCIVSLHADANIQNSEFAQAWQDQYLKSRHAECLRYLPTFYGDFWNNSSASKYNNCYAYAFRNLDLNRNHKPQPGELSKVDTIPKDAYTCPRVFDNVVSDHPANVQMGSENTLSMWVFQRISCPQSKSTRLSFLTGGFQRILVP